MFPGEPTSRGETGSEPPEPLTVELYVRSLCGEAAKEPQEAVIERLSRLERDGVVDEYTVRVWGRRICPDTAAADTDAGRFVLDRIEAFEDWAAEAGASVRSFFDTAEVDSSITGESYEAITVPTLTLAEFRGEELQWVSPCADGGTVYTVADRLDALEADGGSHPRGEWEHHSEMTHSSVPFASGPGGWQG
jgi:hypothetical protein